MKNFLKINILYEIVVAFFLFLSLNFFIPYVSKINLWGPSFEIQYALIPLFVSIGFSAAGFLLILGFQKEKKLFLWKENILLLGFLLWGLISSTLSHSPSGSLIYWCVDLIVILTTLVIVSIESGIDIGRIIFFTALLTYLSAIVVGYMEIKGIYFEKVNFFHNFKFPYGTPESLSYFSILCSILFLKENKILYGIIALFSGIFIGFSKNFPVSILVILTFALYSVFLILKRKPKPLIISVLFIISVLGGRFFSFKLLPDLPDANLKAIKKIQYSLIAKEQFKVFLNNPFLGSGRAMFSSEFNYHQSDELKWINLQAEIPNYKVKPLSLFAKIAGESGLPGIILFTGIFLLLFLRVKKQHRNSLDFLTNILPIFLLFVTFLWGKGGTEDRFYYFMIFSMSKLWKDEEPEYSYAFKPPYYYFFLYSFFSGALALSIMFGWRGISGRFYLMKAEKYRSVRRGGEIPYLISAWEKDPFDIKVTYSFGANLFQYGNNKNALFRMNSVLKYNYGHSSALWIKLQCEKLLNKREEYFKHLSLYVSLNPFDAIAVPQLLKELIKRGEKEKAEKLLWRFLNKRAEQKEFLKKDPVIGALFEKAK